MMSLVRRIVICTLWLWCALPLAHAALNCTKESESPAGSSNTVFIFVHSSIYDALYDPSIKQYIADLEAEDYHVVLFKYISGTAEELKAFFAQSLPDLQGVVLVGTLPYVRYEFANDFNGYAQFPCDLYFMQADTLWLDSDSNGIYDTVSVPANNAVCKIWVGRLAAAPVKNPDMDEAQLIRNYFAKNHAYRTQRPAVTHQALSYIDDDWVPGTSYMEFAYANVLEITDKAVTSAADYLSRLAQDYESIMVWVHSNQTLHRFKINGVWEGRYVTYADILSVNSPALFYNLFACESTDFSYTDNLGGHYVFGQTGGLIVVGSTKTGSMLSSGQYYAQFSPTFRRSIGEGFKVWFETMGKYNPLWHFGMVLVGDPTLQIDPPRPFIDSLTVQGASITGSGHGELHQGSIVDYRWSSDKDGLLSSQAQFSCSLLTSGPQRITFKVRDNLGRWSSEALREITVSTLLGDISGNGSITAYDGALALMSNSMLAEVTGDSVVTALDAALIGQRSVGLIARFPVEG